ncbi:unnamed protein product, partial [Didymodactylos carnosus]
GGGGCTCAGGVCGSSFFSAITTLTLDVEDEVPFQELGVAVVEDKGVLFVPCPLTGASDGLRQHYVKLRENEKNRKLIDLLDKLEFNQVVIFVKSVPRCTALCKLLIEQNFPAVEIHRGMPQEERLLRYKEFKEFQTRILVATNLFGRGMDIERVNIVARAGRFGTKGLAITYVADENDASVLNDVQSRFEVQITEMPDEIDVTTY